MDRRTAPWSWTLLAVALVTGAQALTLLNPDFVVVDCEERFNAAHGVSLAAGHWDALLDLQYRKFCGGCTFDAALAGLLFAIFPPLFGVWKLVPLLFSAAIVTVGVRGLWRLDGPVPALLFALLVFFAPGSWVRLALLGWGNHYESGLFCLALGILAARPPRSDRAHLGVGLLVGFAMWFGFSSTFAVVMFGGWLAWRRRWKAACWLVLGASFAPLMWAAQFLSTHQQPFGTIYADGEAVPSVLRIPYKLKTLLLPRQLAGLFGLPRLSIGAPIGLAMLGALGAATAWTVRAAKAWKRDTEPPAGVVLWSGLVVWTALYLVVDFRLELRDGEGSPSAAGLRYAAPWMPLMWAWLAWTAAQWISKGRKVQAGLLLAPALLSGALTKVAILGAPFPNPTLMRLEAPDHENYRYIYSYALDPREHPSCESTETDHLAAHAFAAGRHATLGLIGAGLPLDALQDEVLAPPDAFWAGVGQAMVDHTDSDAIGGLASLEEVETTLSSLPAEGLHPALYEAAWWRAFRGEPFGYARGTVGSATPLNRLLKATRGVSPSLRRTTLHSMGRRWGLVIARWGQAGMVRFPVVTARPVDLPGLEAFARGLGHGLATKWGPQGRLPVPEGMPAELLPNYQDGVWHGLIGQWPISDTGSFPDRVHLSTANGEAPWPDAGADRWWGPAPTMYCPCKATCW